MKDLQKKINDIYTDIFSYTPQSERISDITNQFFKLMFDYKFVLTREEKLKRILYEN